MNRTTKYLVVALISTGLSVVSFAQDYSLKGRSALGFNIGLWGGSSATNTAAVTGVRSEAKTNGLSGSMLYAHWLQENLSLTLSAGLLSGEASSTVSSSGFNQRASTVIPLLIGIKYYLPAPAPEDAIRPFLSAAVGPFIGMEAKNTVLFQEAFSETAFGGRLGAGIDFLLGQHFTLGAGVGYNLMADFDTPIGARKNYNGAEFAFGFGYIF